MPAAFLYDNEKCQLFDWTRSCTLVAFTRFLTACRGTGARMRSAGPVHGHGGTIEPRCVTMHFRKYRGARVIGDEWFDR